ncbi:MAG: SEC-C metal-binding domain-containing protein [Planctomycetota bacterium]
MDSSARPKVPFVISTDDGPEEYLCELSACASAICECTTISILVQSASSAASERLRTASGIGIQVDPFEMSYVAREADEKHAARRAEFGEWFAGALSADQWNSLRSRFLGAKRVAIAEVDPDQTFIRFPFEQMEQTRETIDYYSVFPFAMAASVDFESKSLIVIEHYCGLIGCACTEVRVGLVDTATGDVMLSLCADYEARRWFDTQHDPISREANQVVAAVEAQVPEFFEEAARRHEVIRRIYRASRQRHYSGPVAAQPSASANGMRVAAKPGRAPGRNDPCSCGSGKKFKKCCQAAS